MKSFFQRTVLFVSATVLIAPAVFLSQVDQSFAYTNYDSCVSGESISFAPNGNLSDQDLTAIETACRREFGTTSSTPTASTSSRATSTPRATNTSTATPTASPIATPTVSNSSTTSPSSTPAAGASSSSPATTTPSSQSTPQASTNSTRSGEVPASMFTDHTDPNLIFRAPLTGANTDGSTLSQYAQPLIRLGDRQLAFQIIVNFFLGIISVVALLFLVFNGYRYTMSRGEDSQISQAKKGIIYSVIGLIVVLAAYTIVATVLNFGAQSSSPGIGVSIGVSL